MQLKLHVAILCPVGFNEMVWKMLTPEERFYLKGLELESHGEFRSGAYQELAKGFGLREYKFFLASSKANQVRLKNPTEFGTKALGNENFGSSLVRHALFAVREAHRSESAQTGKNWLRNEFKDYWSQRKNLIEVLNYFAGMENTCDSWSDCGKVARLVAGAVENDHA